MQHDESQRLIDKAALDLASGYIERAGEEADRDMVDTAVRALLLACQDKVEVNGTARS